MVKEMPKKSLHPLHNVTEGATNMQNLKGESKKFVYESRLPTKLAEITNSILHHYYNYAPLI
jgi:hypothetical protein